jgi:hypothetical protein
MEPKLPDYNGRHVEVTLADGTTEVVRWGCWWQVEPSGALTVTVIGETDTPPGVSYAPGAWKHVRMIAND